MKSAMALLNDRRRRQRGGVLSGVLIITAFLAIIAGALMTELSTHFLVSRAHVNRVATQATVNSAMELEIDQLQTSPLESGCSQVAVSANGRSAVASRVECAQRRISARASLDMSGTRVRLAGRDEYLVGDSGGSVFRYDFGSATPSARLRLGGSPAGPPQAMVEPGNPANLLDLIPSHNPSLGNCNSGECVAVVRDNVGGLQLRCYMPTGGAPVRGQPAAGRTFADVAFFGDSGGLVYAYRAASCTRLGPVPSTPGIQGIVAGPVVIGCSSCLVPTDHIYFVGFRDLQSFIVHFTYTLANGVVYAGRSTRLPAMPMGIASAPTRPAFAVSFGGGQVAVAQVDPADPSGSLQITLKNLSTTFADAPYWCGPCGDVIGLGGGNGSLYLRDIGLNEVATYSPPGGARPILKTPGTDEDGNWFFTADEDPAYVYEVRPSSSTTTPTRLIGPLGGPAGTAAVVGKCHPQQVTVCIYLGLSDGLSRILDYRFAVFTACLSPSATPTAPCTNAGPRLWSRFEVDVIGRGVRVTGWSYYSP